MSHYLPFFKKDIYRFLISLKSLILQIFLANGFNKKMVGFVCGSGV